jgi:hypothetical protein
MRNIGGSFDAWCTNFQRFFSTPVLVGLEWSPGEVMAWISLNRRRDISIINQIIAHPQVFLVTANSEKVLTNTLAHWQRFFAVCVYMFMQCGAMRL